MGDRACVRVILGRNIGKSRPRKGEMTRVASCALIDRSALASWAKQAGARCRVREEPSPTLEEDVWGGYGYRSRGWAALVRLGIGPAASRTRSGRGKLWLPCTECPYVP